MSTRSLRARFVLDMTGNLREQARRFGQSFERLDGAGRRALGRLGRGFEALDRVQSRVLVRGAQLGTAALVAGAALSIRRIGSLEQRLERLGVAAVKTSEEMEAVRNSVNDVARSAGVRIDPGELLSALETFTEATGDFDLATQIQREMALAIQATGSGGEEIGKLVASIAQKFDISDAEGMIAALDTLVVQGKMGAIELSNLAALGPKVFSAFRRQGQSGIGGLAEAGALMQVFKGGVGSADEAATVFENVLNNLYNPEKMEKLRSVGVQTTDADGQLLGPAAYLRNVVTSAKGNDLNLSKVFDAEAMRGLSQLSLAYRETGGFGALDAFLAARGDGSNLTGDAARIAETGSGAFQGVVTNVNDTIEDTLMGPMKAVAEALNALLDNGIKFTIEDAAALAGGAALVAGGIRGGAMLSRRMRRGARGAGGAGGGIGDAGVQPVYVVNWPGGGAGAPPAGGGGGRAGGAPGPGGSGARGASRFGRLAAGAGAVAAGATKLGARAWAPAAVALTAFEGLRAFGEAAKQDTLARVQARAAQAPTTTGFDRDPGAETDRLLDGLAGIEETIEVSNARVIAAYRELARTRIEARIVGGTYGGGAPTGLVMGDQ